MEGYFGFSLLRYELGSTNNNYLSDINGTRRQMQIRVAFCRSMLRQKHNILIACLLSCAGNVNAQSSLALEQLLTPKGSLLCHSIRTDPADSVAHLFQFIDGNDSLNRRTSMIAFDSAGAPLHMMVSVPGNDSKQERKTYVFAVQFFPTSQGGRLVVPDRTALPITAKTDTVSRAEAIEETLTAAEVARAKALADWFWARRCRENLGGS